MPGCAQVRNLSSAPAFVAVYQNDNAILGDDRWDIVTTPLEIACGAAARWAVQHMLGCVTALGGG